MIEELRVVEIEITNFEQIENLTIRPGAVTVIEGKNDSGKTSVLNAFRSLFDLAHDPAFVRHGAEKAIVRMALSDGSTMVNTITRKGMTLVIRNAEGVILPKPATLAKSMADGVVYDVLRFIKMARKDRAAYLEKVMPMTVPGSEILRRIENRSYAPKVAELVRESEYDLGKLTVLRQKMYEDRSLANKELRRVDGTIATVKALLPPEWDAEADPAEKVAAADALVAERREALGEAIRAAAAESGEMGREIDRILAEEIEMLRRVARDKKAEIAAQLDSVAAEIRDAAAPGIDESVSALGVARQEAKEFDRIRAAHNDYYRLGEQKNEAQKEIDILEAAMEAIDRAKAARLKETDIPGLSVVAGEVMYQKPEEEAAIPFDLHNQATQVLLAIKIGMLDTQRLPIILFDGLEALDEENRRDLLAKLAASDYQVLAGRVTDGALTVSEVA